MHACDALMEPLIAAPKARKPALEGHAALLETKDFFGDAMSLAYKLGEDSARPGEVMVTVPVREWLGGPARIGFQPMQVSISGMEVTTHTETSALPLENSTS